MNGWEEDEKYFKPFQNPPKALSSIFFEFFKLKKFKKYIRERTFEDFEGF